MRIAVVNALRVLAVAATVWAAAGAARAQTNVMFVFDASGSMRTAVGTDTRIAIAKRAMDGALKEMPAGVRLGLMMYGHRRAGDCTDIELVSPVGADDAATIARIIQAAQPKGETPIAEVLRQAARNFAPLRGQSNSVVLVTDGIEECRGDPCAAAREIKAAGLDLKVHVVGFALSETQRKAIQCVPDTTGGRYFDARDAGGLTRALGEVRQQTAQAAPPPAPQPPPPPPQAAAPPPPPPTPAIRTNLLAPANGGEVVMSHHAMWERTIDQKLDQIYWVPAGAEAVFGFRGGQAAKFDTFAVFLPAADGGNVKDMELSAGDDGPTGAFRPLGTVTTANGRLRDGWQEFKIPETTARLLKVRFVDSHKGGQGYLYEFRLYGELAAAGPPAAGTGAPAPRANLLAPAQGGEVAMSSHAMWERTVDDKLDQIYWIQPGSEAVFGFRGGAAATFDSFSVYLPGADKGNVKDLELSAGDDGPTGAFRPVATVTTVNARMRDGWQEFKLPETTAKFLKVRFVGSHGGGQGYLYELRLHGSAAAGAAASATAAPAAARPADVLAKAQGGEVAMSSHEMWERAIDGKLDQIYWVQPGWEAVFSFRAGQAVRFDTFAVYLPGADKGNVKELELSAGDDGPTGAFRPLGTVTTVNARVRDGWQEFKLPETTAKFLKVRFVTSHGGGQGYLYELRLFGAAVPGTAAPAAANPFARPRIDALSAAAGGELVFSTQELWRRTVDRKLEQIYWFQPGSEAVFGFRDGAAAKFDAFAVFVPGTDKGNVKDIELLAGDEGPTGAFRPLGVVTTVNARVGDGWQEFKLPETAAKYVKVRFVGSHGGGQGYLYELRLFGPAP